jgi:hypothetical protein
MAGLTQPWIRATRSLGNVNEASVVSLQFERHVNKPASDVADAAPFGTRPVRGRLICIDARQIVRGDTMLNSESNGRIINSVLLLALSAGCGWLLYTQAKNTPAVADRARNLARTLRDQFENVSELTANAGERVRNSTRSVASRMTSRKNSSGEPMAGYGA